MGLRCFHLLQPLVLQALPPSLKSSGLGKSHDTWPRRKADLVELAATFWNIVARNEHKRHTIERTVGSPYTGCYILAVTIFSLGILRDGIYHDALSHQPQLPVLGYGEFKLLALLLFVFGNTLVLSSMWKLGVTGTYLGDYFGILMDVRPLQYFAENLVTEYLPCDVAQSRKLSFQWCVTSPPHTLLAAALTSWSAVTGSPMYDGSTLCFLATALWSVF